MLDLLFILGGSLVLLMALMAGLLIYAAVRLKALDAIASEALAHMGELTSLTAQQDARETERDKVRKFMSSQDGRELLRSRLAARLAARG